jgi:hypothetical protein
MSPINAPNCISCGLGGVYHRVTNPKQWRCRTCGSEFSDDDIRRKRDDERRAEEARSAERRKLQEAMRLSDEATSVERRKQEEARSAERLKQEAKQRQWLWEHEITGRFEMPNSEQLKRMGEFQKRIGREFTKKELGAIYRDLARPPHLQTFIDRKTAFLISADAPILQEKSWISPVRLIVAASIIVALIYACA